MSINIVVPEMGESVVDARIGRWLKKAGDAVKVGEPLVELETDKVDVEVNAPQNGVLASIAHADGADVKIGDVLGVIAEAGAAAQPPVPQSRSAEASRSVAAEPSNPRTLEPSNPRTPEPSNLRTPEPSNQGALIPATPSARRAAREQ